MDITGEQLINKSQQLTWDAISDPAVLQKCIPGCISLEQTAEGEFELLMNAKIGPVSAKFKGKITLANVDAPNAYTLIFEGQGGVAGYAKGEADVKLQAEAEATRLTYVARATVGGKIAQVGSRLIDGVVRKMSGQFFTAFEQHLGAPPAAADSAS